MKTIYQVTRECEYSGEIQILYKGGSKREALKTARDYPEARYISYYAPNRF